MSGRRRLSGASASLGKRKRAGLALAVVLQSLEQWKATMISWWSGVRVMVSCLRCASGIQGVLAVKLCGWKVVGMVGAHKHVHR